MGMDTYSDYRQDVADTVDGVIHDSGSMDWENWQGRLHEVAESTVTYHSTCKQILNHTRNDDALFDQYGSGHGLGECTSVGEVYTRLAFYAYLQDLQEEAGGYQDYDIASVLEWEKCTVCDEYFNPGDICDERRGLMALSDTWSCEDCMDELEEEDEEDEEDEEEAA